MNWLKELRTKNKLTQKELAEKTGVTISTIQNLEQEHRKGSNKTINKLLNFFEKEQNISKEEINNIISFFKTQNKIIYSFDSDMLIKEIKEDIKEFGKEHIFYAMFKKKKDCIFLINYDFIQKENPLTKEEIKTYDLILKLKANEILEILELQNEKI